MQYHEAVNFTDMAIAVLQRTNDGEDLHPPHLYLLQEGVNNHLTDEGIQHFTETVYEPVMAGTYRKPWLHGIEHLTIDHEGWVYWKDKRVEHFSFPFAWSDEAKECCITLAAECATAEAEARAS